MQLELFGNRHSPPPDEPPQSSRSRPGRAPERYPHLAPPSPPNAPKSRAPETLRAELFRRLSRLTGGRLRSLSLTDNRRTILSVRPAARAAGGAGAQASLATPAARSAPSNHLSPSRRRQGKGQVAGHAVALDLRIHRSFAAAPEMVLRAVATFLASARGSALARQALAAIREHFQHHRLHLLHALQPLQAHPSATQRRLPIDPQGAVLDLREIAADLNHRYFEGRLRVRITWGKAAGEGTPPAHNCRRTRTTSLQLGSYSYEDRLIRIHRVLDRPGVPRYVVESVVYHELLHADLPPVTRKGRRYFHTPEFRRRERQFRNFEKADLWVRQNLQQLLRARREATAGATGSRRRRS